MRNPVIRPVWIFSLCVIAIYDVQGQTEYDFGNPGGLEQELLEQINRARANPEAEGLRLAVITDPQVLSAYDFFNVDLDMMRAELKAIPVAPPLAHNKKLAVAALGHSQWMFDTKTQAHNQTNPSNTPGDRVTASGYTWTSISESIFAFAENVTHCHAGFEVDWGGGGTGGMQAGRGHRVSNHNAGFREIGIGIILGTNAPVGPMVVTEDFARDNVSSRYYATGVAYYDLDGDDFYDAGEGIAGLRVDASGTGITQFCTTATGGGWVIPMTSTGLNRTITFTSPGFSQGVPMTVPANSNAKADLKLAYTPPAITSLLTASANVPYALTFSGVVGATGYRWDAFSHDSAPPENCESVAGVVTQLSPAYTPLSTTVFSQGSASFHLQNSNGSDQTLELGSVFHGGAGASLAFSSRIRFATTKEFFRVQVKEEGSSEWLTVDTQVGTGGAGDAVFANRTVPLGAMAGKRFRVRFLQQSTGSFFTSTGDNVGWFIDAIQFADILKLTAQGTGTTSTTSASVPLPIGSFLIYVSPTISGRNFPPSWASLTLTAGPVTYISEMTALETSSGLAAGTLANFPLLDFDGDGFPNLVEYALGTSVVGSNDPAKVPVTLISGDRFVLRYRRDLSKTDITVTSQAGIDLVNWKAVGESGAPTGFTDTLLSLQGDVEIREAGLPITGGNLGFLRVLVTPD